MEVDKEELVQSPKRQNPLEGSNEVNLAVQVNNGNDLILKFLQEEKLNREKTVNDLTNHLNHLNKKLDEQSKQFKMALKGVIEQNTSCQVNFNKDFNATKSKLKEIEKAVERKITNFEEVVNENLPKAINAEIVSQLKNKLGKATHVDSERMEIDQKKDFKVGFPQLLWKENKSKLADEINTLTNAVESKMEHYTHDSLLSQLEKALPLGILSSLGTYNNLNEAVQALKSNFNNPGDLYSIRNELNSIKFKAVASCASQAADVLNRILLYNRRCETANRKNDKISPFQCMQIVRDKIFQVNPDLAADFLVLWNGSDTHFLQSRGTLQTTIAKLEEKYVYLKEKREKKQISLLQTDTASVVPVKRKRNDRWFEWLCFRCDNLKRISLSQRAICNCGIFPKCEVRGCTISHLTKHHNAHMKLRGKQKRDFFTRPNTQGTPEAENLARSLLSKLQDKEENDEDT